MDVYLCLLINPQNTSKWDRNLLPYTMAYLPDFVSVPTCQYVSVLYCRYICALWP